MRISASSTLLACALFSVGAAYTIDPDDFASFFGPLDDPVYGSVGAASRCLADGYTKTSCTLMGPVGTVPAPQVGLLSGVLVDGCGLEWENIKGTRRERGSLYDIAYTNKGDNDCAQVKVQITKATATTPTNSNLTAAIKATTTVYGEELRSAVSYVIDAKVKSADYSAPAHLVANQFYKDNSNLSAYERTADTLSIHGLCPNQVALTGSNATVTCGCDVAQLYGGDLRLAYWVRNPTDKDVNGLKATVTFNSSVLLTKLYLPKSSPRLPLVTIDKNKADAGVLVNTTQITVPLAARRLPSMGAMSSSVAWNGLDELSGWSSPILPNAATLKIMKGGKVLCEAYDTL